VSSDARDETSPTPATFADLDPRRDPLSSTSYAVLGLLSFGRALSGYDLKKWADRILPSFYTSPAISQIYGELRRLEDLGLVDEHGDGAEGPRNKRLFRITPAGASALSRWVGDAPMSPPVLKHSVLLRVWLGHMAQPEQLRRMLTAHRVFAEEMLAAAEAVEVTSARDPAFAYPHLVARWAERYYTNERDSADQLLAEIDALEHPSEDHP